MGELQRGLFSKIKANHIHSPSIQEILPVTKNGEFFYFIYDIVLLMNDNKTYKEMSLNKNQIYYGSRDADYMNNLKNYINENHDVDIIDIELAKRGYMAETYKAISKKGKFFVKIVSLESHKKTYKESFDVVDFLNQKGIDFIIKNIKTRNGNLTCDFEGGVLGLFNFVEGEHSEDYPLKKLFEKYSLIYKVNPSNLNIRKENFKGNAIELFELNFNKVKMSKDRYGEVIDFFDSKMELIKTYKQKLRSIGKQCNSNLNKFSF